MSEALTPEPVGRTPGILRVNTGTTTTIPAGYRSWSVYVVAQASVASPTLGGVALPLGVSVEFSAPNDETMRGMTLVTATGDDVVIVSVL